MQIDQILNDMIPSAEPEVTKKHATDISEIVFDMLMLSPPAIVCMPEKFKEAWHTDYREHWDKSKTSEPLFYFRPLMLHGTCGPVAVKALVGNINPLDDAKANSDNVSPSHINSECCMDFDNTYAAFLCQLTL